jgi:uncharacterized protein (TIGR02646 family)
MIQVNYTDPTEDPRWQEWRERAEDKMKPLRDYAEAMALVDYEGFVQPKVSQALYKAARAWLMKAFNGKCAYCEAFIQHTQYGDVEHFRPKGAVEQNGQRVRFATRLGEEREHPGYFWLAYEWSNLLISCVLCNQPGKHMSFPLAAGSSHALTPAAVAEEAPQLINPRTEDPAPHVVFDETGTAIGLDARGVSCVEILNLNRDELLQHRKDTYRSASDVFERYMGTNRQDPRLGGLQDNLAGWQAGRREYSAVARIAIAKTKEEAEEKLRRLGF